MDIIKSIVSPLLNFIYPPVCIVCNKLLHENENKVCSNCWKSIPTVANEHPLYQDTRSKLIETGFIDELVSCYVFEKQGTFQHIAHALKYKEYKSLGFELGKHIGDKIRSWSIEADLIIPVPLHKVKFRERGYNQSDLIAQGISSIINKPVIIDAVIRTRHTQTQTKLNLHERRKNMQDAFAINLRKTQEIIEKKCLLIDDVITTGATTSACAKELIKCGVNKVVAASAALAE